MKSTIDPKKAIAVIGAVSVFIVGGYILGHHIIGEKENGEVAAANSPIPPVESTYNYEIDSLPDGIVGKETAAPTPTPSAVPEEAQNTSTTTPNVKASTAPTPTPAAGSTGSVTAPASTPAPSTNSGSSSSGSTPAAGSTNSSGQFYDPVFGWMTPTGGESIPSNGDGDGTIIGTMG